MELFRYYSKNGQLCIVHIQHHEDRFNTEWSLRINLDVYEYYKREQDAKAAGTRLKKHLIENGITIMEDV